MSTKAKLLKNTTPTNSLISNILYSGIDTTRKSIQSTTSSFLPRTQRRKLSQKPTVISTISDQHSSPLPLEYHSWKSEYYQIHQREILRKCMNKNPYLPKMPSHTQANVTYATEDECCDVLIPANAVHINESIIHEPPKQILPNTIRYVRAQDITSERFLPPIFTRKQSFSTELTVESKLSLPLIPNLATADRLLNRAKVHVDASIIRRPPRLLKLSPIKETIAPLKMCA